MNIEEALYRLSKSKFRSSFYLKKKELDYIKQKGLDVITSHAQAFIDKRLGPDNIANDGKQTPYKGHPVFIAQHATATCCRGCLNKWYHIPKERELTDKEVTFIVTLIMEWIKKQIDND